jgi:hypothetical protein
MKWFFLLLFLAYILSLKSQPINNERFLFKGFLVSEDSLPVSGAYLVNYRNIKAYHATENGFFSIPAQPGDSFAVAHISFDKMVIIANPLPPDSNKYTLYYSFNQIGIVDIKFRDLEIEHMNKNMTQIREELSRELYLSRNYDYLHNAYAPPKPTTGLMEIDFIGLYDRLIQNEKRLKKFFEEILENK